jgi:hypothetical protein
MSFKKIKNKKIENSRNLRSHLAPKREIFYVFVLDICIRVYRHFIDFLVLVLKKSENL